MLAWKLDVVTGREVYDLSVLGNFCALDHTFYTSLRECKMSLETLYVLVKLGLAPGFANSLMWSEGQCGRGSGAKLAQLESLFVNQSFPSSHSDGQVATIRLMSLGINGKEYFF